MTNNIAYQQQFRPELSTIYGPSDYRDFRNQLEQIDHLLVSTGIEERFLLKALKDGDNFDKKIPFLRKALRVQILLHLTNENYRSLAFRLADSELFRWFIGVTIYSNQKPPAKSSIQRFEHIWPKEDIESFIHELIASVCDGAQSEELLFTETPLEIKDVYADSTCIKANIHYPVDWLLFRDAIRTVIGSIKLIRSQGLRHRMKSPDDFMKKVNNLTIAMTQASRNRNGKKEGKKIFRRMKKLLCTVEGHAHRYRSLLEQKWQFTDWSAMQTNQVLQKITNVTRQIPAIIDIAHKRIISEKKVANAEKILSLYEKDVHVIKRGKMDADVEFGNGFYLAEQKEGLIVDWDIIKGKPCSDTQLLKESTLRIKKNYPLNLIATDRGFNSKNNDKFLRKEMVYNATCPRDPEELIVKMADEKFKNAQKRRAQTEARIGIFKNKFIGHKILRKGFENREDKALWSILTHNLWVVARIANRNQEARKEYVSLAA